MSRRPRVGFAFPVAIAPILLAILAGCAAVSTRQSPALPPALSSTENAPKTEFAIDGRIAVRKGENAFAGSFRWRHDLYSDEIDLTSPLGQTVARLTRAADGIHFAAADGRAAVAPNWESLTERELGWPLPVSGLVRWMQGAADPDSPYEMAADELGRPRELRQFGWTILYLAYDPQDRPTRLRLSRDELDLRLVVDSWQATDTLRSQ